MPAPATCIHPTNTEQNMGNTRVKTTLSTGDVANKPHLKASPRTTHIVLRVDIRPCRQQFLDHRSVPIRSGIVERGPGELQYRGRIGIVLKNAFNPSRVHIIGRLSKWGKSYEYSNLCTPPHTTPRTVFLALTSAPAATSALTTFANPSYEAI